MTITYLSLHTRAQLSDWETALAIVLVAVVVAASRLYRQRAVQSAAQHHAVITIRRLLLNLRKLHDPDFPDRALSWRAAAQRARWLAEIEEQTDAIRRSRLRGRLYQLATFIGEDAIPDRQPDPAGVVVDNCCGYGLDLIDAYLADEPGPAEPAFVGAYQRALEDYGGQPAAR